MDSHDRVTSQPARGVVAASTTAPQPAGFRFRSGISRKDITAFTREMSSLLGASIPIPQALDGLGEEEESPALRAVVLKISDSVRKGAAFSSALEDHPRRLLDTVEIQVAALTLSIALVDERCRTDAHRIIGLVHK